MLVRFGDVYCRYCSYLRQWLQSNWLFCWFIHHNYVGFVIDHLMISLDREIPQDFCRVIFRYLCWLVLVPWYVFLHVPVAREHECIYRRYHDVRGILLVKDHRNLIWCGGWFLFWHGRFDMYHHLQYWRLFLIYLVEFACFWMAAIVDSSWLCWLWMVAIVIFSGEDCSHWLDRPSLTWVLSRYFANYPCIFFLLGSTSSLLIVQIWWWFSTAISSW